MIAIIKTLKERDRNHGRRPFSVYSSFKEQKLLNVPISSPTLIVVLNGRKEIGKDKGAICNAGEFIFLPDNPLVSMRNIPEENNYFALIIEFDRIDLPPIELSNNTRNYYIGNLNLIIEKSLQQFIDFGEWAPAELWSLRKRELIELLCSQGHQNILSLIKNDTVSSKVRYLYSKIGYRELSISCICERLAMSESTLRRKLKSEGTSIQGSKDQIRLGLGLHLIQSTEKTISIIADSCGYRSPSKFSAKFKSRFGVSPSDLRKTKMAD